MLRFNLHLTNIDIMNDKISTTKNKVVLEYTLSATSVPMIWDAIATAPGLAAWFADSVSMSGKQFEFVWGKHEARIAELINSRQGTYVRFHWLDEDDGTYFEMRIVRNDLTGNYILEITDFADLDEEDDVRSLWDSSIDALKRCGV